MTTTTVQDDLGNNYAHSIIDSEGAMTTAAPDRADETVAPPDPAELAEHAAPNNSRETRHPVEVTADIAKLEDSVTREIHRANSASANPVIYTRGGKMAEIAVDAEDGSYRVADLSLPALRSLLYRHCWFYKTKQGQHGESERVPAKLNAADLAGMHERVHTLNLPAVRKFTQCPVYDTAGQLHSRPGYNREVGAFIHYPADTSPMPPVRDSPTQDQARQAAQWLRDELFADFLFASEDGPAGVLGLMLAPMVADMIQGPRPLVAFDAPEAGSGKTLLAQLALWHVMPNMPFQIASGSMAEFEKTLTSQARKARPVVAFDNLNVVADSGTFAGAITGYPTWETRQLGVSENITFPAPDAWVITGNGLELSNENARRTLTIRILKHHPSYADWRHPTIRQWVHDNRGKIQAALATMVNAWLAAGRPAPSSATLPSFEQWAHVIGGILEHAGVDGLLRNRSEFANPERQAWAHFGGILWTLQREQYLPEDGATASQIITAVNAAWQDGHLAERPQQVDTFTTSGSLGSQLRKWRGSSLDEELGLYLVAEQGRSRATYYRVEIIAKT